MHFGLLAPFFAPLIVPAPPFIVNASSAWAILSLAIS